MPVKISPLHVRRSILIERSPDQVWHQFSTLDRIRSWLGIGQTVHQFDLVPGGTVELSVDIEGSAHHFGGAILVVEKNREITFERLGSEAADNLQGYEEGWTVRHLTALRSIVEGT